MFDLFNKLFLKIIAIVVIVLFIIGFRESIITDSGVSTAFGALMGTLPFAKVISDVICKIMKYQYSIPIITSASILSDFLRLAVMACIQPLIVGILSMLFLKLPGGNYHEQEEYMDSLGYKVKELLITILTAPFIAIAASYLTSYISDYFTTNFGIILSTVLGVLSVVIFSLISIVPLLIGGVAIGTAISWRVVVTLFSKMATTFGTNSLCLWIYFSFVNRVQGQILTSILALIVWLIIMDCGMQCLRRVIVSKN